MKMNELRTVLVVALGKPSSNVSFMRPKKTRRYQTTHARSRPRT